MFAGTSCDLCCRPQHEDSTASWSTPLGKLVICIPCNDALMDRLETDFYDARVTLRVGDVPGHDV